SRVRSDPQLGGATIMMLSSSGQHGEAARCKSMGITNHLTKPIDQRDLLSAMSRALAREQAPRPRLPQSMLPAELPERRLHVLLAEDNAVNQRLAASLLERRGHRVTIAANGREALAALDREPVDAILMDVQMPKMRRGISTRSRAPSNGGSRSRCAAPRTASKAPRPTSTRAPWSPPRESSRRSAARHSSSAPPTH